MSNLYTNIEQSKRLLNVGVPINSADCLIDMSGNISVRSDEDLKNGWIDCRVYFPCWSFGRLIDISIKAVTKPFVSEYTYHIPKDAVDKYLDQAITDIETGIADHTYEFR